MVQKDLRQNFLQSFQGKKSVGACFATEKAIPSCGQESCHGHFLGKNYLGQSDNPTATVEISDVPVFVGESEIEE